MPRKTKKPKKKIVKKRKTPIKRKASRRALVKKKKVAKKKLAKRKVAKRKVAKKKSVKKKAVRKKRTVRKIIQKVLAKKVVRPRKVKAVIPPADELVEIEELIKKVAVVHASDLHAIKSTIARVSITKKINKNKLARNFSFPLALSQVRDSVEYTSSQPKPEETTIKKSEKKFIPPNENPEVSMSPYVLDLKRQKTVLQGVLKANPKNLEKKDATQSILSLFEPPTVKKPKTFGQNFTQKEQSNFAPIPNKFEPAMMANKVSGMFAWRWKYWSRRASEYRVNRRNKRLQRTLALPKSFGVPETQPLFSSTRSGQPIRAKKVKGIFLTRRELFAKSKRLERKKLRELEREKFGTVLVDTRKMAFSFAAVCMLFILPMAALSISENFHQARQQVLGATNAALSQLQEAKLDVAQLQFPQAAQEFAEAGQAFQAIAAIIDEQYSSITKILSFLPIIGKKLDAASSVLSAGQDLAEAATYMSQAVEVLVNGEHFLAEEELSYKLEYLFVRLQDAAPHIRSANDELSTVDISQLPEDFQTQVLSIKAMLPSLVESFSQVDLLAEAVLPFVGHESMQRYLLVFQNNTELRATGGFIGSLALVDVDQGQISNIEVPGGGPYDYQGSLLDYYVAPRAIQLINPRWELQDVNWFFDWPTSAAKIAHFYESAGGPSVDGVIAIDTQVLEALLVLLGPVELEEYNLSLTADNFRELLQEEVEDNYDKELNQPKKIIGDLAPKLLEKIKNLDTSELLTLAQGFSVLLQSRDILLQHNLPEVQNSFSELGWSGEVVQTESDYLAVVHTNLAGGKTDGVIDDEIDVNVHIDETGKRTNTVTIRRTHNGIKGNGLTGVRNVDYLRIYVPLGSQLIEASGFEAPPDYLFEDPDEDWLIDPDLARSESSFVVHDSSGTEIYQESGKTVFANWVMLDPGEVAEVKFVYQSPVELQSFTVPVKEQSWADWFSGDTATNEKILYFYDLYIQKQSGSWTPQINVTMNFPQDWQIKDTTDLISESGPGSWHAQASMIGDSYWSWLLY